MRSGDWGNLFILANSGLFLASVILQNAGVVDVHSASFAEDGLRHGAEDLRSSHAMSFYADAIGAVALAYLARIDNNLQANERAERNERAEDRNDMRSSTVTHQRTLSP